MTSGVGSTERRDNAADGAQRVRDAMVPDPHPLEASATAQEAGEALMRPEVRAVLVCDDGAFVGVITRKTLVREVVARGRDPRTTTVGEIAEPPNATFESDTPLADAFERVWELSERDGVSLRSAALITGIRDVAAALEARGIYP